MTEAQIMDERISIPEKPLYEALKEYAASDYYPFHMPGHKRCLGTMDNPYSFDITEIDGFDDLHHPEGILRKIQERAAGVYGADQTFLLVNGSTSGILTAVSAVSTACGGAAPHFLVARNCHRSVYHAMYLNRAGVTYLYPGKWKGDCDTGTDGQTEDGSSAVAGRIDPEDVRKALTEAADDPGLCGVVVTSPTYDGVVSDVAAIAAVVHAFGKMLIVDEAHGAHFGMHPSLPPSSAALGADLVIHSLHKTLPALTQTALLHVNGRRVDEAKVKRFLDIYQTSSPSYVLMASADQCIRFLEREKTGSDGVLFERWLCMLRRFYTDCASLNVLKTVRTDDPGKILIQAPLQTVFNGSAGTGELPGERICAILRDRFHIEPEMAAGAYALCISTVADTPEGLLRLQEALRQTDGELCAANSTARLPLKDDILSGNDLTGNSGSDAGVNPAGERTAAETVVPLCTAWDAPAQCIPLEDAAGAVSAEFVYLYPPGIPIVVPGERIDRTILQRLLRYQKAGYTLHGTADPEARTIRVLKETVI